MSTNSKVIVPDITDVLCQGDIFKNVKYNYIYDENNDEVQVIEYEFPLAVIISQACDVVHMSSIVNSKEGKPTKFMPSILMCPIYDKESAKSGNNIEQAFNILNYNEVKESLFNSNEYKIIKNDWHYRFHYLELYYNNNKVLENTVIDYKHYFTVPASYLINNRQNRVYRLEELFAEQVTLKFATFLSRVAIPD